MAILAKLKLVPDDVVSQCLGATSQFNSATAGLGLFARNRRERKLLEGRKKEAKSHKLLTLEKQNMRKRLAYSKGLNTIVREMGKKLTNDEDIPLQLWTEYDRLQRNPCLKQRTKTDMELGTITKTPGPGAYIDVHGDRKEEKNGRVQITFGKSERWRENTTGGRESRGRRRKRNDDIDDDSSVEAKRQEEQSYIKTGKLSQTAGKKWGEEERTKLNNLYWELGRPKRKAAVKDHYNLYATRHRVLYKNRPAHEVIDRLVLFLFFYCWEGGHCVTKHFFLRFTSAISGIIVYRLSYFAFKATAGTRSPQPTRFKFLKSKNRTTESSTC